MASNCTVCSMHEMIMSLAKSIDNFTYRGEDPEAIDMIDEIQRLASDIYDEANRALSAGQRMEDRLRAYREAIEGLGFKRT